MPEPLPIDPYVPEIVARLRERRSLVLTAAPGAGKTTRVPPALAAEGPVIVLQPRRVAARSIARRIADEQGWTLGREVGWHVRFERRFASGTQVLLATEGILTARLQQDPLLTEFRTVVLDEFHERTIHADLGLALAKQAWRARDDLRLVVMSATLDVERLAAYLDDCPVIAVPGTAHPVDVRYMPGASLPVALTAIGDEGSVLVFLPGAPEIARASRDLSAVTVLSSRPIVPLHGGLPAAEQDAAVAGGQARRIVLTTNIAETSVTVADVRAVVDTGLQKVARYDPARGIDRLETERIAADSAAQRAGRAGRLGPGQAVRLWDPSDRLRAKREPEIARVDLSPAILDVLAWGGDPRTLDWLDPPRAGTVDAAFVILRMLGAVHGSHLTPLGREMQRIPLHPRLARILLAAGATRESALACALLSEPGASRSTSDGPAPTSASDVIAAIERGVPPHVARAAASLVDIAGSHPLGGLGGADLRRALLAGYPDRVARRRAPGSPRVLLASGHGAVLTDESGVRDSEFLIALDIVGGRAGETSEARIRMASAIDRAWLGAGDVTVVHTFDSEAEIVRAEARRHYGAIALEAHGVESDPAERASLLARVYLSRPLPDRDVQLWRRLSFAGIAIDRAEIVATAAAGAASLGDIDLVSALPWELRRDLETRAPERLRVPSGRDVRLEYLEDGGVSAEVKLQEVFGLADTPRVGPCREPVLLALLAPNGRPVQLTRDLRSFWERTYPEVRKELRGRYPKHPWPEDPWTATPTARTLRRPG